MRSFFLLAAFGAATLASETLNERFVHHPAHVLDKRQQFAPSTQMATGDTCAAAFGTGYVTCREKNGSTNRLCYNPDIGQKCCDSSWACPSGSVCMPAQGQCCPTGGCPAALLDPNSNTTSTLTASVTSTATRISTVTGSSNSTTTRAAVTLTGTTSSARSTSTGASGAASSAKMEMAGTLVGLVGLAAALL